MSVKPGLTQYCPYDDEVVERDDLVHGFQIAKGKYVQLTEEELEALEAEANRNIELKQFVPLEKVDPIYFKSSHYLGPDEGGEKAYRLLSIALDRTKRIAVAQLVSRGKEELVLIRPYKNGMGMAMHTAYYANEIRDFSEIPKGESARVGQEELELALKFIELRSQDEFHPEAFKDEYRLRLLAFLEAKRKGEEITVAPEPKARRRAPVIDIMQALKQSLDSGERIPATGSRAIGATRKTRKRAS